MAAPLRSLFSTSDDEVHGAFRAYVEDFVNDFNRTAPVAGVSFDNSAPRCSVTVTVSNLSLVIPVGLDDVQDLVIEHETLDKFVWQSIAARFNVSESRQSLAEDLAMPNVLDDRQFEVEASQVVDRATSVITAGQNVFIVGPSASGKSVASTQAARRLTRDRLSLLVWMDLTDPSLGAMNLLRAVFSFDNWEKPALVVLDNLQSSPTVARECLALIRELQESFGIAVRVLAIGWPSAATLLEGSDVPKFIRVPCTSHSVLSEIVHSAQFRFAAHLLPDIERLSRGDLLVARAAIDFIGENGRCPSLEEVASYAVAKVGRLGDLGKGSREFLYWLACLGTFEVEVEVSAAETVRASFDDAETIEKLRRLRWLRLANGLISVGHRTFAIVLKNSIERLDLGTPQVDVRPAVEVAVDYLKTAGDSQILSTLERLDLSSRYEAGNYSMGGVFLARLWSAAGQLSSNLERMTEKDPTWGDNTASATFAAQVFASLGRRDLSERIVHYVRSRWDYGDGTLLPINIGSPTADRVDFDEIVQAMRVEDEDGEQRPLLADDIDADRFHRSWALGLLLGIEDCALIPDQNRRAALVGAAASAQSPDGSYYPSRVPWITARIVLGLSSLGESVYTSQTIRKACNWLRREYPYGSYSAGAWQSGTGAWNTPLMTTSMAVLALLRAGVDPGEPAVRSGLSYLLGNRPFWMRADGEIDGSLAIESVIEGFGNWQEYSSELADLLSWAATQKAWADVGRLASESHTESSKTPFIAASLISITWALVKRELPGVLEGLASDLVDSSRTSLAEGPDTFELDKEDLRMDFKDILAYVEDNIRRRDSLVTQHPGMQSITNERARFVAFRRDLQSLLREVDRCSPADLADLQAKAVDIRSHVYNQRQP